MEEREKVFFELCISVDISVHSGFHLATFSQAFGGLHADMIMDYDLVTKGNTVDLLRIQEATVCG